MSVEIANGVIVFGVLVVDFLDLKAFEADALVNDVDFILLRDVGISLLVPKSLGIIAMIERLNLAVQRDVPQDIRDWRWRLSDKDAHFFGCDTSCSHRQNLGLFIAFADIETEFLGIQPLKLTHIDIPYCVVVPEENVTLVHAKIIKTFLKESVNLLGFRLIFRDCQK